MVERRTMVSIETVDRLVGLLVVALLLVGGLGGWLAARQMARRSGMMGMMPGANPVWYLFGTLLVVSAVLGVYVLSRAQLADALSATTSPGPMQDANEGSGDQPRSSEPSSPGTPDRSNRGAAPGDSPSADSVALRYLPDDERRVVEPILESPGLTQVELRARSEFSKAKVSQTVGELEDRGLIYRERQGRTYRVYPGELLKEG